MSGLTSAHRRQAGQKRAAHMRADAVTTVVQPFVRGEPPDHSWWADPYPTREAFDQAAEVQRRRMTRAPNYRVARWEGGEA